MNSRNNALAGRGLIVLASALLMLGGPVRQAAAQQIQGGGAILLLSSFIRGVDTTFDPSTNGYFVVGAQGAVVGMCVNADGIPTSGLITINNTGFGAFPRARYSPQIGGFLVVWGEEVGNPSEVHARTVTCGGQLGPEQVISGGFNAWIESGAAIAYSTTSQRFLVAWKSLSPALLRVVLVDNGGAPASGVVTISAGFARDPGAAWNPQTNEFGVSYTGESGDTSFAGFAVVPAGNPGAFRRTTFGAFGGGLITISDLDYAEISGRYLMGWFELSSGAYSKIAEFDAGGNLVSTGVASSRLGSYDALSLAYNSATGTTLLTGLDRANDAVLGVELNSRGFPFNGENTLNSTFLPTRYPRVAGSRTSGTWNVTYSGGPAGQFGGISTFRVTGFTGGGGPGGGYDGGGTPPPPPPPDDEPPPPDGEPPPPTGGCTTIQPGPDWTCVNGNWLPPGSGGTTTGGCTTVSPGVGWTCVNGNWLPPDSGGTTGGCTTISPGPDWTCVNGNWLPPGSGGTTGGCTTIQPGPDWTCVNGGWLPPGAGHTSTSSCTTISPGVGWTCVNGNWLPPGTVSPTSACPTLQPGPNWTCDTSTGNWLPPGD